MIEHAASPRLIDRINALIDWYEKNKPEAGQRIPVWASSRQIARAIGRPLPDKPPEGFVEPQEFFYRGRILLPIGERD